MPTSSAIHLAATHFSTSTDSVMFKYENSTESSSSQHPQDPSDWGPKRDPLFIVIPFTALFATIFLTGIVGNVSTCIVIARNKSMHTATNYYLFSLAISDLLLLISGLPQEMYYIWSKYPYVFGEMVCVLQGFAAETSANTSVLTITAFTVERYIAICHPFLSQTMSKLSRAIKLIIVIWIFAVCSAVPQAMSFGIVHENLTRDDPQADDDHYICNVKRTVIPHAFLISTILFFVTPMSLITVLYILIGIQLRQSSVRPVRGTSVKLNNLVMQNRSCRVSYNAKGTTTILQKNGESKNVKNFPHVNSDSKGYCTIASQTSSQHVVRMLVAVVVAFFICWAPFHAQRLLAIYAQPNSSNMITAFTVLTYISGVLYYMSTTINPVLYHIMSHRFRMAFKETYYKCLPKKRRTNVPQHYSNLSRRLSLDKTDSDPTDGKSAKFLQAPSNGCQKKRKLYKGALCYNSQMAKSRNETDLGKVNNKIFLDYCNRLEEVEVSAERQLILRAANKRKSFGWITDENFKSANVKVCINCWRHNDINIILKKSVTMPEFVS